MVCAAAATSNGYVEFTPVIAAGASFESAIVIVVTAETVEFMLSDTPIDNSNVASCVACGVIVNTLSTFVTVVPFNEPEVKK